MRQKLFLPPIMSRKPNHANKLLEIEKFDLLTDNFILAKLKAKGANRNNI